MLCSICGEQATCLVPITKNKGNSIVVYEGRCNLHKDMSIRKVKQLLKKKGKL